jgi:prepilin-type N-terminal cleavage/methylation domain-containing protein
MLPIQTKPRPGTAKTAFSLVELLVVIAIISILMTAGSIGLSNIGGKGVTSGVSNAEALFNEARTIAVGKNTKARVLVAKDLTDNKSDNLRRILVAYSEIDPATGGEYNPERWVLATRAALLPEQTFFSQELSRKDGGTDIDVMPSLSNVKASYAGSYFYYEFNSQGICTSPGASFVIGSGARRGTGTDKPVVTSSAKRDFGGFVIWRNGGTSVFRSPEQIAQKASKSLPDTGKPF